jgi:hypothetical protein
MGSNESMPNTMVVMEPKAKKKIQNQKEERERSSFLGVGRLDEDHG